MLWKKKTLRKYGSSDEIRAEITALDETRSALEAESATLQTELEDMQIDLLDGDAGAEKRTLEIEAILLTNRNKIAGSYRVEAQLKSKLDVAVEEEREAKREQLQADRDSLRAEIDKRKLALADRYAQCCIEFADITGQAPYKLGHDFFVPAIPEVGYSDYQTRLRKKLAEYEENRGRSLSKTLEYVEQSINRL